MTIEQHLQHWQSQVSQLLEVRLPQSDSVPHTLHRAMRYGALNGGKRIRPILVFATGQALGATEHDLSSPALAVELIHCYSLVHDDLPAMDDDDLRRGKPTCHIQFN